MSDHPDRHCGAGQREPRRTVRRGGLVWVRCRLGRWGWFVCVRSQSRPSSTHLRKGHSEWRRLGGTCRGLAGPRHSLYVRVPRKVSRRFRSSVVASHGPPLYPSVDPSDLLRRTGQCGPKCTFRRRASNPFAGGFPNMWVISCRFPSWPVRKGLPVSLYAISRKAVARITWSVPRLHTPSSDSLSATPVPISAGEVRSVRVNACRSVCSLCGRMTICPEKLATERPEARRVHTGHLASRSLVSRRKAQPSLRWFDV